MQPEREAFLKAMVRLAGETEFELAHDRKRGPLAHVLLAAREPAIAAMVRLVECNPHDDMAIAKHQTDVRRYLDLIEFTQKILADGTHAERELSEDDRRELNGVYEDEAGEG